MVRRPTAQPSKWTRWRAPSGWPFGPTIAQGPGPPGPCLPLPRCGRARPPRRHRTRPPGAVAAAPVQRDAAATTHLPVVHSVPVRIGMLAALPSELRPLVRKLRLRHADEAIGRKAHVGRLGRADITAAVTGMGPVAAGPGPPPEPDAREGGHNLLR